MSEGTVRALVLEIRRKSLWWVSTVNSTMRYKRHNSPRGREKQSEESGKFVSPKSSPLVHLT